jgi:hypothetical protein
MHADLYNQLVDQLIAEVLVTRDLSRRDALMRQAAEWHEKAKTAAAGAMVPPSAPRPPGQGAGSGRAG